jgi:hypothetical protein
MPLLGERDEEFELVDHGRRLAGPTAARQPNGRRADYRTLQSAIQCVRPCANAVAQWPGECYRPGPKAAAPGGLDVEGGGTMKAILKGVLLAATLSAASIAVAHAETWKFKADLSGKNESPPNDSTASGSATATYDTATKTLTWHIEYTGLSGPAIGAHIHGPAPAGTNAGIMLPFADPKSPIDGSAQLTDAQEQSLTGGGLYVNIHTKANPGGELRGQLVKQ